MNNRLENAIVYSITKDNETQLGLVDMIYKTFGWSHNNSTYVTSIENYKGYQIKKLGKIERQVSVWDGDKCIFNGAIHIAAKQLCVCNNNIRHAMKNNSLILGRYSVKKEPLKIIDIDTNDYLDISIREEELVNGRN